jgi:hypothetical protein
MQEWRLCLFFRKPAENMVSSWLSVGKLSLLQVRYIPSGVLGRTLMDALGGLASLMKTKLPERSEKGPTDGVPAGADDAGSADNVPIGADDAEGI